jgi:enoyl-CoA hydratase
MDTRVTYRLEESVATIVLDDGKANVLSPAMQGEINAALDRAAADYAAVLLRGRDGVFSGGFDLNVLRAGGTDAVAMVRGGFELAARLLSFPAPVVIGCTGHAVAMGVFLILSGDYRVGASGPFKIVANEVAIGLTMPLAAVEICRQRLTPAAFNRAVILSEPFSPDTAVDAGFLDQVVDASSVEKVAHDTAVALAGLDRDAHAATKSRARRHALDAIRAGIEAEDPAALRPRDSTG